MSKKVTIELKEDVYELLTRAADEQHESVEDLILHAAMSEASRATSCIQVIVDDDEEDA